MENNIAVESGKYIFQGGNDISLAFKVNYQHCRKNCRQFQQISRKAPCYYNRKQKQQQPTKDYSRVKQP